MKSNPGIAAALGAALLFGAGAPLAKLLLEGAGPWMLAGIFYLGSGLGLWAYRRASRAAPARLPRGEAKWLAGAIAFGGVAGPVLLMLGLSAMPASGASLLLNAEGVFTALLAWFAFHENFDRRIALGMVAIAAGALLLSWPEQADFAGLWPALAILGACFCWGIDNNLTRKVSLSDATWIASVKGLCAGSVNLALALIVGDALPSAASIGAAMLVGFLAYGVSLALFVVGLRHLGAARTGAYFSVAPFFGAILALAGGEPITAKLLAAGLLMGLGVWLHLTESHAHAHVHEPMEHAHEHAHDEHHQHAHPWAPGLAMKADEKHTHPHRHEPMEHEHAHFPDAHHQHSH
ncbi:Permease of the drug/metabolite transporter (DMT) superfamily [Acidovorax soli]|uniref:Permease of the drug/metabolite transporter (DMT) superfamily n=2 Tax=Acidovorax soli TaxID=592050 RepID=A0A1H4BWD2_9BURK|nr:Permease of the drug/metabolite transporter (DMT) superfamily [Acidovorax soli]